METKELKTADIYFRMIENLSPNVKLDLINKISESLKGIHTGGNDDSWKELFGAWNSDESAEEIIDGIRNERHTNRRIEDL